MRLATTTGTASIAIPYITQSNAAPAWIRAECQRSAEEIRACEHAVAAIR